MFKIAQKDTVNWPVTVGIPKDGGGVTKATFTATFLVLDTERIDQIIKDQGDLLEAQLVGWPDGQVKDANDEPVAFSDEAKVNLLKMNNVRVGLFNALQEINQGRAAARKN